MMCVMHALASQFSFLGGFLMPISHEKRRPRVAETGRLLVVMQYRFCWNQKTASQVASFQTQTYLQCILRTRARAV